VSRRKPDVPEMLPADPTIKFFVEGADRRMKFEDVGVRSTLSAPTDTRVAPFRTIEVVVVAGPPSTTVPGLKVPTVLPFWIIRVVALSVRPRIKSPPPDIVEAVSPPLRTKACWKGVEVGSAEMRSFKSWTFGTAEGTASTRVLYAAAVRLVVEMFA
jgi:hypothetical protein